jgi:hypothetical protein
MDNNSYSTPLKLKAAPMTAGAVLLGAGALMGMAGMIVGGHALGSCARRWFREQAMQSQAMQSPAGSRGWGMRPKMTMATAAAAKTNGNGHYARSGNA